MKLDFSILWFDDTEDYFDSLDWEKLKNVVLAWGFNPDFKTVLNPNEFNSHSPFTSFDLIIVDRDLDEYPEGQKFIAELRENAIYTEVIFYTSLEVGKLWDAIREEKLEGVFISTRDGIFEKISQVGYQSIRKILDLENMRGIVLAEVGELDHRLDQIITTGFASLSDKKQNDLWGRFYKGAIKQNQDTKDRLDAFSNHPETAEMLALCDSNKRWQSFNRLWKEHDKLNSREKIGEYDKDVLTPRNFLAHGKPEPHKNGGFLFRHRGSEYHFNDGASLKLRKTILKYKEAFSDIYRALENGQ